MDRDAAGVIRHRFAWPPVAAIAAAMLAGCAVGPDFRTPDPPDGAGYAAGVLPTSTVATPGEDGAAQAIVSGQDIPGQWWALFHSRPLNTLIERALKSNPGLQASQAALRQAQENVLAQTGTLLPSFDANDSVTRQQASLANFGQHGPPLIYNLLQSTVNVSYAPDVFGGKRRQIESVQAQADYQQFQLEASYLTLTANVVTAAVQEASLRGQIEATEDIIKAETQQLNVMREQFALGGSARTDVLAQEAELVQTQAMLPPLQKQLAQQRHVLMALTGRFPNQDRDVGITLKGLRLPTRLPLSLPSQLVKQRPDIRAAEEQLHQASAQIGVAVANLLPQFNLTADYGSAALAAPALFTPGNIVWSAGASVSQPIFHGGTLLHQERAAVAAYEMAEAQYRNTVLTAFQNVADALRALQDDARALQAQERSVRVASESLDLSRSQFQAGSITYLTLLNAQRTYEQARLSLVQAQATRLSDTAALFQALGGGWWNRDDVIPDTRPKPNLVEIITGNH